MRNCTICQQALKGVLDASKHRAIQEGKAHFSKQGESVFAIGIPAHEEDEKPKYIYADVRSLDGLENIQYFTAM